MNELGIGKEDAKYLLSIVGIANTVGRVVLGYVADRPWINRLYLYNISLAICGLCKYLLFTFPKTCFHFQNVFRNELSFSKYGSFSKGVFIFKI